MQHYFNYSVKKNVSDYCVGASVNRQYLDENRFDFFLQVRIVSMNPMLI